MYLTAVSFPSISQDLLIVSKHAIYHKEALLNGYQECNNCFETFNVCEIFRVIFEKVVFLKNGWGRHHMRAMLTHFVLVVHEIQ